MNRRSFIRTAAAGAAATPLVLGGLPARAGTSLAALAQMPALDEDRILVIIQLFGGNDGLNTLLPMHDQEEYRRLRPRLAIADNDAWNYQQSIYLHPALAKGSRGGVARMLEQGTLALVQGVGYDNPNLSHFRSTDIWLSGINDSNPSTRLDTGWIGRYLEERFPDFPANLPDHPLAIQLGGFSLTLMSSKGRMGIEVSDPSQQRSLSAELDQRDTASAGTRYAFEYDFVADIAARSNRYATAVKEAYEAGKTLLRADYGTYELGRQMGTVAALIAGGLRTRVYVVSLGGFDTHFTQQVDPFTGTHPMLLERVSDAIAQFNYDITRLGFAGNVIGMTISEFGRRPAENGSLGTDHGAAGLQMLFGARVNSGVFGMPPDLRNLNGNGDLVYQIDYRQVYAEVLGDWFGLTRSEIADVLRSETIEPVDVLQASASAIRSERDVAGTRDPVSLHATPNPFHDATTVEIFLGREADVEISLVTTDGRRLATIANERMPAGAHRLPVAANLAPGAYLITARTSLGRRTELVEVVR